MSNLADLADAYMTQRDSILIEWRNCLIGSSEEHLHAMFRQNKKRMNRKLRRIYPRGKLGDKLKNDLVYFTPHE